jgi:hypothetical protein
MLTLARQVTYAPGPGVYTLSVFALPDLISLKRSPEPNPNDLEWTTRDECDVLGDGYACGPGENAPSSSVSCPLLTYTWWSEGGQKFVSRL